MPRIINPNMKNKKMNSDIYKLRRRVMTIIYDARKLAKLPRINVRITGTHQKRPSILGMADMGRSVSIWIPEKSFNLSETDLRYVVYHEILHTVYGIQHKDSGLMGSTINYGKSRAELDKMFKQEVALAKRK